MRLNLHYLTIISQVNSIRQLAIHLPMQAYIVTGMNQIGLSGPYPLGETDGIVDKLMGVVGLVEAQGIHHEQLRPRQIRHLALVDGLHIGNISQSPDAETQDRQLTMHHLEGHDLQIADMERLMRIYLMEPDGRDTRITVFYKTVGQHLQHRFLGQRVSINVDFPELAIGSDVVHTSHVIVMAMGDQYTVDLPEGLWKDLLPEVGATVDEQARGIRLDKSRATGTLVVRVWTLAHLTLAADDRHATRSSRS